MITQFMIQSETNDLGSSIMQDVDETVGFKLRAGDSYNIILPDIAQF